MTSLTDSLVITRANERRMLEQRPDLYSVKGGEIKPPCWKFVSKSLNKIKNHPLKDLYVKIYTIGYYSSFYSSLKDKNSANGGHFEFPSKDEEKG